MEKSKYQQYFYCFIVCILISYVFCLRCQQNIVVILISASYRGAALIRGEELIRGRRLFQFGYIKVRHLLESNAYFRPGAYQRKYGIIRRNTAFLHRLSITCWYLYGALILEQLSQVVIREGFLYGTAKLKKLKIGEGLKELTVSPIISNSGTVTYKTVKYLKTLLTELTKSQYNILNTDDVIQKIKSEKIPEQFKMISFDVNSLFTNMPLDRTIEIILSKICQEKN